jgi:hypothetical protein
MASGGAFGGGEDASASDAGATSGLIHPGGILTQSEMNRIRTNVAAGQEPWASAWTALKNSDAGPTYQPTVTATVTDAYALQNQGHAAYVLAIKWVASGDIAYATASKRILDAWVDTVTSLMATTTLRTGVGANQFANAAEIMAYGFNGTAGWPPAQIAKAKSWFGDVVWPVIGQADAQRSSNWGTSAMAGCMATAIFTDDRAKLDYTVNAYKNGFTIHLRGQWPTGGGRPRPGTRPRWRRAFGRGGAHGLESRHESRHLCRQSLGSGDGVPGQIQSGRRCTLRSQLPRPLQCLSELGNDFCNGARLFLTHL